MHPLYIALPVPYVSIRVTRNALVAHRYTKASPRCRTSQYHRIFISLSVSLWNNLADPVFDDMGLAGFKSIVNAFFISLRYSFHFVFYCFPFLFFLSISLYFSDGVFGLIGWESLSPNLTCIAVTF